MMLRVSWRVMNEEQNARCHARRSGSRSNPPYFPAEAGRFSHQRAQVSSRLLSSRPPSVAVGECGVPVSVPPATFQKPLRSCFLLWALNQRTLDVLSGHTFGDSMHRLLEKLRRSVDCADLGNSGRALARNKSVGESRNHPALSHAVVAGAHAAASSSTPSSWHSELFSAQPIRHAGLSLWLPTRIRVVLQPFWANVGSPAKHRALPFFWAFPHTLLSG